MNLFKERVKERTFDVLDWIDYRPDPHWWQYLAVPLVLVAAYFFTPMNLWPFIIMGTVGATLVGMIIWFVGLAACVAWRAIRDVIGSMLKRNRQQRPYWPNRPIAGPLG